ncbi:MAG: hypothetical protein AAF823_15660 [Planctomycetota bacterium]
MPQKPNHLPAALAMALALTATIGTAVFAPATTHAQPKDDRAAHPVIALQAPDGWTRTPINLYLNRNMGFSVEYDNEVVTATLFQYDRGLDHIPDDLAHDIVREEVDRNIEAITDRLESGRMLPFELLHDELITLGDSAQQAHWLRYQLTHRGVTQYHDNLIWSKDNQFLKLRYTINQADDEHQRPSIHALLTRLGNNSQE